MQTVQDERAQMERVESDLLKRFTTVPAARVHDEVQASSARFDGARVRTFVPVLVQKLATDRLRSLGS